MIFRHSCTSTFDYGMEAEEGMIRDKNFFKTGLLE